MDPSGFNLNRIGNALRARMKWREGKFGGPPSLWAPIIVIVIVVLALLWFFYHPRHKVNWSLLSEVPPSQAQQVKTTSAKLKYSLVVPTKLPFTVTEAHATVTGKGSVQSLQIQFRNHSDTITEQVTNDTSNYSKMSNIQSIQLPDVTSAYAGDKNGLPVIRWNLNGILYTLAVTKWDSGSKPSTQRLIEAYKSIR